MLNAIIKFSIKNKLIVMLMVLGLIAAGVYQLKRLPIDALPDITSNQVQVITVSPALAAPEVERLVTFSVEQFCANIQGVKEMRSISRFGLSVVTIVFDDNTDIYWARQQVAERLVTVKEEMPAGIGLPTLAPLTTGLGEVYQYIVKPAPGYEGKYSLADLRTIQDWIIRRQLLGTAGVADVSSFGGHLKQYEVAFDANRLKSMGLTVADLYDALQKNNQNSGGAYIEKHQQVLFIRTEGLIQNIEEIGNILLHESSSGTPIYVRDVAEVRLGKAIRYGALVDGAEGEVSGAVVLMLKGANGMEVVNEVKRKIASIQKTLPEGVVVEPFYDRSKMVNRAISTVKTNLMEGALIVIFVLVLFLGNVRAGLIVASVIPLAMLFAVCMMNLFGVSGNLMSLGALDFGLIIDGAVIIVEAVLHRLHHKRLPGGEAVITQQKMDNEVEQAAGKMMNAAVFGQVIILIVYLPILALVGVEGKMFKPMAQTVSFALVGAFLLSLTYVPMITTLGISKTISSKVDFSDKFMQFLEKLYLPFLKLALRFKKALLVWVMVVFVGSILLLSTLGGEFIPELEEGDFAVDTRLLTGSSLSASVETSRKAADVLQASFPEIEKIVSRIGASEIPTDPMPIEMGDLIILLKDKKEWTSAESYDELADKMSKELEKIPGLSAGFQFPVQMRFNELISGARQDVVCKIFGEDLDSLAKYAERIGAVAEKVEGASDLYVEAVTGLPQIVVDYNRQALAMYGANVSEVNQVIRTAFAGESAGLVYENEKRYDLVMRMKEDNRSDIADVQDLLVSVPGGRQVPLHVLANVQVKEGPNQIQRENAQRRILVAFNVRNRDVESVVKELQQKVSNIKLPPGYSIHYGGAFENLNAAKNRLSIAVPVSLLLILLLLYFAFRSLKHSLLIFSAIPLSAIGGVFALWLRDLPFSISAGVGFIALFGVAVLNGIVLITEFNRLKQEGRLTMDEIIFQGTKTRFRPVLMTAAVASLGFLPMALSHSAGSEVQRPLASVVIGGLISATFLTLIVLPVLYEMAEKVKARKSDNGKAHVVHLTIVFLFIGSNLFSQKSISLSDAYQLLQQNNTSLKAGKLQSEYLNAMQLTAGEMPRTKVLVEGGQTNSKNFDTKVSFSQTFLPFGFKSSQRSVFEEMLATQKQEYLLQQADLRMMVRSIFIDHLFQQAVQRELMHIDSLYSKLSRLAEQRLKAGETNSLESAGIKQQQAMLQQQLAGVWQAKVKLELQLKMLLQTTDTVVPNGMLDEQAPSFSLADSTMIFQHPSIAVKVQLLKLSKAETALEKARLKPEFEFGYNNQSLIGYQTMKDRTEKYYEAGNRFNAVQAGINFPLFGKAAKAKVKAAQAREQVVEKEVEQQQLQTYHAWQLQLQEHQMLYHQLMQYKNQLLPNASNILKTAAKQLSAGELNYVNWMLIVEPSMQVPIQYLLKLKEYNQSAAMMEYFVAEK